MSKVENDNVVSAMRTPATLKDALRMIEDAYNHGRTEKNRVRFY